MRGREASPLSFLWLGQDSSRSESETSCPLYSSKWRGSSGICRAHRESVGSQSQPEMPPAPLHVLRSLPGFSEQPGCATPLLPVMLATIASGWVSVEWKIAPCAAQPHLGKTCGAWRRAVGSQLPRSGFHADRLLLPASSRQSRPRSPRQPLVSSPTPNQGNLPN